MTKENGAAGVVQLQVSLEDIAGQLCEPCQERLIDYLAQKASTAQMKSSLREQLLGKREDPAGD